MEETNKYCMEENTLGFNGQYCEKKQIFCKNRRK